MRTKMEKAHIALMTAVVVGALGCGNAPQADGSDDANTSTNTQDETASASVDTTETSDPSSASSTETEDETQTLSASASQTSDTEDTNTVQTDTEDPGTSSETGETQTVTDTMTGEGYSCRYTNPFSSEPECREYLGDWTAEQMQADCSEILTGLSGTIIAAACSSEGSVGTCYLDVDESRAWVTTFYGLDEQSTATAASMCASYWGGTWHEPGDTDTGMPTDPLLDEAQAAMRSDDVVAVRPECADTDCLAQLATAGLGIEFAPVLGSPLAGVILLPEQGIDPRAYAPAGRALALQGLLVSVLTSHLAIDHVVNEIESHGEIEEWFLGGHGQGGTAAAGLIASMPDLAAGLVLWGAVIGPQSSLSSTNVPMTQIYGLLDGIVTPEAIDDDEPNRPDNAAVISLRGANHEQFAYWRGITADNSATVDRRTQHDMFVGATSHFVRSATLGFQATHAGFEDAQQADAFLCRDAQLLIANTDYDIGPADIQVTLHDSATSLGSARPAIDTDQNPEIEVQSYDHLGGNPTLRSGPPVHATELWCKMKSQDAIVSELGATAIGPSASCGEINLAVLEQALELVSSQERQEFLDFGPTVTFEPDLECTTGPQWLSESAVSIVQNTASSFAITSPRLEVPLDSGATDVSGNCYCKIWSVSRALRFVLEWR